MFTQKYEVFPFFRTLFIIRRSLYCVYYINLQGYKIKMVLYFSILSFPTDVTLLSFMLHHKRKRGLILKPPLCYKNFDSNTKVTSTPDSFGL